MAIDYKLISADSHLEIKPERWAHRVDPKYRDQAPRTVTLPDGGDGFIVDGQKPVPVVMLDNRAGHKDEEWKPFGLRVDDAAGAGPPEQRVEEMKIDGIDAEILFPGFVRGYRMWRGIKDDAAYRAVVRGWNDWVAEEYCSVDRDRLLGLGVIPSTNLHDALDEIRHCSELGLRGVVLGTLPSRNSYPSQEDDEFWALALELNMPVTVHVAFHGELMLPGPPMHYPREDPETMEKLNNRGLIENLQLFGLKLLDGTSMLQMVFSGVFDRFPDLNVYFAETRLGWIPFWMEQVDNWYGKHIRWSEELLGFKPLKQLPSEYVKQHLYWSIQCERFAAHNLEAVGEDHVMFATDFPHVESEWPDTKPIIDDIYADIPEKVRDKVWAGNAVTFFNL